MWRCAVTGTAVVLVVGCATRPACDPVVTAAAAVDSRVPPGALADRHPSCDESALASAYGDLLVARCDAALGWQAVRAGLSLPASCADTGNRLWREAIQLAGQLNAFEAELADVQARLDQGEGAGPLRLEQVRLTREIDQIRGVAAIRGWEQAQAPEG